MPELMVVFGATGQQGNSIIDFILNDTQLSVQYSIRAISRDPSSSSSEKLSTRGVEVVSADPNDPSTLQAAMQGAHTVFSMTFPDFNDVYNSEVSQGHAMVDAAVAAGVSYYIYSTLPNVSEMSGGKYTKVAGFDAKAHVETYIRSLPIRSAFFAPGSFMQNYQSIMKPRKSEDGTYVMARHVSPQTMLPLIDIAQDTGKWVGAILAEPDKFEGKVICAAARLYSLEEQADILSKATGQQVVYKQIPKDVFRGFLPPGPYQDILIQMMLYQQDFGYYGSESEVLVKSAVDNARGTVATFEEYLARHPLVLE